MRWATVPAFLLPHNKTLSACSQGHLRTLLIDVPWLLCHSSTQQALHAGSSHLRGVGIETTGDILSSLQLLILHYLDAELRHHKEGFFHSIQFFFTSQVKMYLSFLESWADYFLLSVPCLHFVNRARDFDPGWQHFEKTAPSIRW